ncbi:carbohydrate ABC transporter membrane protein 1, CUT1 family (TC 3.A.1.1.-) [Roseomonas rosea]|uniref:Carbohydrate ABC transporter membrane protein 1, CUT1 family (TC 3.A.1.1.-) n=1 Tax=Muricoccus roseus TaxID=198092 RepID=A0A1M6D4I1_9PROT|nr:sugar ABC transporter permease [Roseomonas rosea]SHI68146.1 carbohydrate ABC transporter membrane protein 1, CUT1 family (TC 3.A.1.1.-) [Roseomonas rosea]
MSASLAFPARRRTTGEALAGWMLTAPAALAYALMLLLPTLATIALAFTDYELGADGLAWIGLDNFAELLRDRGFAIALRNTILYVALVAPLSVLGGLALALLIETGTRGRAFFRAVFFLPVVSLPVAMAAAWQYLLHPTIGPLNAALRGIGIEGPAWLSSSDTVLLSLAAIGVWENIGFNLVLFLAGLTAIPRELYAAAEVDGATSGWERFRLVTWPLLGPTTLFVVTITMTRAVRVFDSVAVLTQGGPNKASEVLLYAMYEEGFTYFRLGYSAAITLVFLAIVLALVWLQTKVLEKRVHYA